MRTIGVLGLSLAASLAITATAAGAEEQLCPKPTGSPSTKVAGVKPTVALSASGPAEPMNMGGLRGTGTTDIIVNASPPLPATVTPEQITLDLPKRLARTGPGLTPAYLPNPTFSMPRLLERGKLVAFTLCVDASKIEPGSYVGQVIIGGPPGVQPATVAVTLNAKNEGKFDVGLFLAAAVALALLFFRGMKVNSDKIRVREEKAEAAEETAVAHEGKAIAEEATALRNEERDRAANLKELAAAENANAAAAKALIKPDTRLGTSVGDTFKDVLGFWAPTVIAVGAAVIAMLTVYDANVSWGADETASLLALGGTAVTAAGVGTFLSSLRGS